MRRPVVMLVAVLALTSCLGSRVDIPPAASPAPSAASTCDENLALGSITFTGTDGRCVPSTDLQMVRCDLDLSEVMVRGAGTDHERRFLGGPYRVAVNGVPPGVKPIATLSTGLTVFAQPGAPDWLWVQDALGISRWLALPKGVPWEGRDPSVAFIGDSITDGASPFLTAALPGWTAGFDAEIGRPSSGGVTPAGTVAAADPPPDAAIVELGTNDNAPETFRANVEEILSQLYATPLVIWQTAHGPMDTIPQINAIIREAVTRYPTTAIADWNKFVTPDMLVSDGVHPRTEHEGAMASLEAPLLDAWRAAVEGRGATGCLGPTPAGPSPS